MNTSPKTARLLALAAALAVAFWAADRAFAAKDFSELSGTEMRKTLEDAHLADDSYGESDAVRDGYKPSGTFMSSKNIELRGTDANGNPIFTFKNLDSFDTYAGTLNRTVGLASGKDKRAPCAYTYDPKTGMISPLTGDSARSAGFNPHPPNFNAQVLEKDGTTHIAFRGSGGSLDDWVDTNTGQMVGGLPPQFEMADKLVESVQEIGSGPIRLSGHSEGAGEVQYATLGSLLRGKTDISGSAFNYQQLSANVRDIFPPEVLEKAKDHLRYVRIGNDPVSGLPMIGVGALGEEYTLDNAEWKGGEGKDDDWRNGWMTKEQLMWLVKGLTDRGEAHRMGNVLDAIQGEIGDKIRFENLPDSVKAALAIAQRDKWMDELAKEMDKYDGRTDLTPEEQAEYEQLKSEYEMWQLDKEWYQDKMKKALEEEEQKEKEEAKKAEEEAAKEAGVEFDEDGNPIIGDFDDYVPLEDPDNQDWTPFEDDEEPQVGGSPYGDDYNPFKDDGKEPEEGGEEGEEGGEEESFEPEEETDEFEPGQEPETEDEDEPSPPEEDEEQEPYEPEEDEEAEPYEPEEDEEQEPYEPEENEEPEATEPEENEEPEPTEPEEEEEPEPAEPEEEEEPEPYEPEEEELERYEPPSSLRDEPKLDPDNENYEPYDPNPAFKSWLDQQTQASENRGNDSKILNQYTTQEKEQESKNTIARQDAENTVNQGGQNSQTINQQSASTTATSQDQNSWQNTIVGAFEESITGGLVSMGTTFAENAAQNFVNKLFPPEKQPDDPSAGGGGGGGGQNGGQPGGKKSGGKKGGGGGKKGGGGGGGGHDHGEGGSSEGDSGDHDDDTGGSYDDHESGGGYDDGGKVTFNTPGYVDDGGSSESDEDDGQKICIRCKQKKSYLEWDKDAIGWVCYDCLNRTVPKEEPQEEESSGCGGPVHHGCGGCVYEAEWDDDKGGRFWKCEKCGHKDHWGPWLE